MAMYKSLKQLVHHMLHLRRRQRSPFLVQVFLHVKRQELENQKQLVVAVHDVFQLDNIRMVKLLQK